MNKEKFYESPRIMEIELVSEQTVLANSVGTYTEWEEEDWGK